MNGVPLSANASAGTLGRVLREARLRKKLSLRAVTSGTTLSYSSLSRLETGQRDSAPLDALMVIAERLGLPQAQVSELAGGLTREGIGELVGGELRGALRSGRLSPDGVHALRRVHLRRLLEPFSAHFSGRSVDPRRIAKAAGVGIGSTTAAPGFDIDSRYLVPHRSNSPPDQVVERAWIAHGVSHALIADDAGRRRSCNPRAQALMDEQEATYVASLILVPVAALAAALRLRPLTAMVSGEEIGNVLEEISSDFRVPATFAATRLAEDAALAEIPL